MQRDSDGWLQVPGVAASGPDAALESCAPIHATEEPAVWGAARAVEWRSSGNTARPNEDLLVQDFQPDSPSNQSAPRIPLLALGTARPTEREPAPQVETGWNSSNDSSAAHSPSDVLDHEPAAARSDASELVAQVNEAPCDTSESAPQLENGWKGSNGSTAAHLSPDVLDHEPAARGNTSELVVPVDDRPGDTPALLIPSRDNSRASDQKQDSEDERRNRPNVPDGRSGGRKARRRKGQDALEPEHAAIIANHFLENCLRPAAPLQRQFNVLVESIATDVSGATLFHTNKPVAVLMQWRSFMLVLCLFILWFLVHVVSVANQLSSEVLCNHKVYRFTTLENRAGSPPTTAGIMRVGLLLDGCAFGNVDDEHIVHEAESVIIRSHAGEARAMNGFLFTTGAGDPGLDPVRFKFEGSDDEVVWERCGSSSWHLPEIGPMLFLDHWYSTTTERGGTNLVDMRATYSWVLAHLAKFVFLLLLSLVTLVLALHGRPGLAVGCVQIGLGMVGACMLMAFVLALTEKASLSWLYLCDAGGFLALVVFLYALERSVFELSALVGFWWCACRILNDLLHLEFARNLYSFPPVHEMAVLLAGVAAMLARRQMLRRAAQRMENDKKAYVAVWETIQEKEQSALEELKEYVTSAKREFLQDGEPRQYHRQKGRAKRQSIFSWGAAATSSEQNRPGLPGLLDMGNPVESLDQLYAQAVAVEPVFRRKVRLWAEKSNGLFRTRVLAALEDEFSSTGSAEGGFVRWKDAVATGEDYRVKWPTLKSPERAVDKIIQSYGGQISRLLDICRQSIVFDDIQDLLSCLELIFADTSVKVHTIKNRYDSSFDASNHTAGFRDLVLNLRHDDDSLRRVAAETHVCELQLILRGYAALQNAETHLRYLQFRQATSYSRSASLWKHLVPWFLRRKVEDVQQNATTLARSISGRALGGFQAPTYNPWGHLKGHTTTRDKVGRRMAISPRETRGGPAGRARNFSEDEEAMSPGPSAPSGPKDDAEGPRPKKSALRRSSQGNGRRSSSGNGAGAGKGNQVAPEPERPPSAFSQHSAAGAADGLPAERGPEDEEATARSGPEAETRAEDSQEEAMRQIQRVMEEHLVAACTKPAGKLDEDARRWNTAMAEANTWSAFHTSAPLVTATTLRGTVVFFYLLSVLFLVDVGLRLRAVTLDSVCDMAAYRLVDLEQSSIVGRAVVGFALMHDGCIVDHGSYGNMSKDQILLEAPGAMNGFAVVRDQHHGRPSFTADRWRVEGSNDLTTWTDCSGTAWGWRSRGEIEFHDHDLESEDEEEHKEGDVVLHTFDLRPPWPWRLITTVPALRAITFFLVAWVGRTRKPERTHAIWLSMHLLLGLVQGAAAIRCQLTTPSLTCLLWFLASVASVFVGAAVFMSNKLLPMAMVYFLIMMAIHSVDAGFSWYGLLVALLPDALCFLLGVLIHLLRQMVTNMSIKKIEADKRHYDLIWVQLQVREGQRNALASLGEAVRSIHPLQQSRQFARKEDKDTAQSQLFTSTSSTPSRGAGYHSGRGLLLHGAIESPLRFVKRPFRGTLFNHHTGSAPSEAVVDLDTPITSLDQLFVQAAGVEPLLRCKVQDWALKSRGRFPCWQDGTLEFVLWEEMVKDSDAMKAAKWPTLKSSTRAIQKALRSYTGDMSRLMDLCRHQIVFNEVAELTSCLQTIIEDEDVVLVRVKNRLANTYDARVSAGYRDVALNLRLSTPQTCALGVETHVCELQLILKTFAQSRSNAGHKRYVEFRNALAA